MNCFKLKEEVLKAIGNLQPNTSINKKKLCDLLDKVSNAKNKEEFVKIGTDFRETLISNDSPEELKSDLKKIKESFFNYEECFMSLWK